MKKITLFFSLLTLCFTYAQTPTTNAATPPSRNAADVISIFSDAYSNIAVSNFNPGWGQSGSVNSSFDPTGGGTNFVLAYTNFNYQGTDIATQDASSMEFIHIDIWTSNATVVKFSPINNGTGASEFLVNVPLVTNGWSSVDLPKSSFTGMTWDSVFQMKFDGQAGATPSDIYIDNVYFWKTATATGSDATLSDLKIDGTTISGFSAGNTSYNYGLPAGTTTVPQITMATPTDSNASVTIHQATAIPGDATVDVVSQNGSVNKTYTVSYAITSPSTAAPTPPARNASDVISLFSDAYTDITIDTWSASWDDSSISDVQIAGNNTKQITFNNFLGVDFSVAGHHIDASAMTNFHMDFWTGETSLTGKVFNSKFSQWGGTSAEVSALELNINTGTTPAIVSGSWVSIDVPISQFVTNLTRDDIAQFIITSNLGTVYVDNIYLYKGTPLGIKDFKLLGLNVYPNPTNNNWVLSSKNDEIISVDVFDLLGRNVIALKPNKKEVLIDASKLSTGVYLSKITTEKGTSSRKLIKN